MRCVALSYACIASHIQTEHWIHSVFELGLLCFCCRLHPHGLYIYLPSQSDTFSTWSERTATKKMLLLSRPSSSSSIHDAHFLCLQHIVVVVVVATFAFDSIFYPSDFFRCSCCAGPKPHCVLFRLQIAPSLLVCSHFRRRVCVSVFFAWIPYDFSPLYALRGVHLSEIYFILACFYCRRCRLFAIFPILLAIRE